MSDSISHKPALVWYRYTNSQLAKIGADDLSEFVRDNSVTPKQLHDCLRTLTKDGRRLRLVDFYNLWHQRHGSGTVSSARCDWCDSIGHRYVIMVESPFGDKVVDFRNLGRQLDDLPTRVEFYQTQIPCHQCSKGRTMNQRPYLQYDPDTLKELNTKYSLLGSGEASVDRWTDHCKSAHRAKHAECEPVMTAGGKTAPGPTPTSDMAENDESGNSMGADLFSLMQNEKRR